MFQISGNFVIVAVCKRDSNIKFNKYVPVLTHLLSSISELNTFHCYT